ncbi:hypothetical protein BSKO_02340 [Bryopsis sp. KO-2023]|nr:hypothetical protein BSKO_02340 [Bryopsis sp. KO-2023]
MPKNQVVLLATPLSLDSACKIIDGALDAGRKAELLPLTVVVVDTGGHIIALKREDGSGIARVEIATGKAAGALGVGMAGRTLKERFSARVGFQAAVASATNGRFMAAPGGVLILNESGVGIGAVGVSGDASDKDEYAAIEGVKAAGMVPEPISPAEGWEDAPL